MDFSLELFKLIPIVFNNDSTTSSTFADKKRKLDLEIFSLYNLSTSCRYLWTLEGTHLRPSYLHGLSKEPICVHLISSSDDPISCNLALKNEQINSLYRLSDGYDSAIRFGLRGAGLSEKMRMYSTLLDFLLEVGVAYLNRGESCKSQVTDWSDAHDTFTKASKVLDLCSGKQQHLLEY